MTDDTKIHTLQQEIHALVKEVHEVSKAIAVHAEKLATFSEKISTLPCEKHIYKFDKFEDAITNLAVSQAKLIESHTTVKKLVFGTVTLLLTLSVTAIYEFIKKP